MTAAPVDLAAYRATRDEPEPEAAAADEPWTVERHVREYQGGVIGELAVRLVALEQRLSRLERRGRL